MKKLLTPDELIAHMENRGVGFTIVDKEQAHDFLLHNNYYKKLSAYKKNYIYGFDAEKKKIYSNLEFAYLQELSKIDAKLRYLIIQMCLDIEHAVKIFLINKASEIKDDGYKCVENFLDGHQDVKSNIASHGSSLYCRDMIAVYNHRYPLWIFLEVISFGDLCKYYVAFCNQKIHKTSNNDIIFRVRELRNAAAHSHCLINDLKKGNECPLQCISSFVSSIDDIKPSTRQAKLSNHFINDFVSMLYFYDKVVESEGMKNSRYKELNDLFAVRMLKHKEYFATNSTIRDTYTFVRKVVDKIVGCV